MADENLTIWMATFVNSRKVAQIRKNPEVHLTTGVTDMETAESYLQIQGRAEILTDEKTKKAVWNDHLENIFSGPDDPNYCVCKITPYRIEYQGMGMVPPEVWEV
ncbi:MAG: pyridoxamine 5'-phosphate oxidase family protein [Desulfobacteraceae bacterium]|nr:pyridoxamine 5'-phosphate oxidase family protein [Desulfobacteraceae bacterium]